MKIISWNVNGIRAWLQKDETLPFVEEMEMPDIFCVQETKAHPEQVDIQLSQYPYHFWNSADKKGYSGTAIFSKVEPIEVNYDMGIDEHEQKGFFYCQSDT